MPECLAGRPGLSSAGRSLDSRHLPPTFYQLAHDGFHGPPRVTRHTSCRATVAQPALGPLPRSDYVCSHYPSTVLAGNMPSNISQTEPHTDTSLHRIREHELDQTVLSVSLLPSTRWDSSRGRLVRSPSSSGSQHHGHAWFFRMSTVLGGSHPQRSTLPWFVVCSACCDKEVDLQHGSDEHGDP